MQTVGCGEKARHIVTEQDSVKHEDHLLTHIGCDSLFGTGNYLKVRTEPKMNSKVIGHLEQADHFVLHDIINGLALIEVVFADLTSPDSWIGLTGWVDADYLNCHCTQLQYEHKIQVFSPWKEAYLQAFFSQDLCDDSWGYAFIFVDHDDIPEIVLVGETEAGGSIIFSYQDGQVFDLHTRRIDFSYIERGNLLCNSAGHMGVYYDYVYRLEKNGWNMIGCGEYGSCNPEDEIWDEANQRIIFPVYEWNGLPTSCDSYQTFLDGIYDSSKAIFSYTLDTQPWSVFRQHFFPEPLW